MPKTLTFTYLLLCPTVFFYESKCLDSELSPFVIYTIITDLLIPHVITSKIYPVIPTNISISFFGSSRTFVNSVQLSPFLKDSFLRTLKPVSFFFLFRSLMNYFPLGPFSKTPFSLFTKSFPISDPLSSLKLTSDATRLSSSLPCCCCWRESSLVCS